MSYEVFSFYFLLVVDVVLFLSAGFPALVVALSLSIAAGKDGLETFVSDE